ncbi:MAG: hypothetical protein IPK22_16515 [Verrucomicrobiaceae bacterium]|nr:hypothetical protein [Verrucomicrobiaceae bacterium]
MSPEQAASLAPSGVNIALIGLFIVVSLICWIKVLIALFKNAGVGLGILGIICSLFAFIWGWVKSGSLGLRGTMIAWTVCTVGMMAVQGKMAADMVSNPEMQKLIQEAQQQAQQPAAAPEAAPAPANQ